MLPGILYVAALVLPADHVIAAEREAFEPPFTPPACGSPCLETPTPPNCNPIYVLERYTSQNLMGFIAEYLPDFDRYRRQVYIVDQGDRWDVSYIPAIDAPPEFGGGFPVLEISKAECKVVEARFYQ